MHKEQKFSLDLTAEEAILLLTGARLLDKLVAGISIHAKDREELIRDIISKLANHIPPTLVGLSDEIAEAIVESVFGVADMDDEELDCIAGYTNIDQSDVEDSFCNYPMYPVDKILPILEKAIVEHQTLRASYYSFVRETVDSLTLNPLSIVKENNLWRMMAYCLERNQIMIFRVDRIKELNETVQHFEVPRDFNPRSQLPFAS